MTKNSFLKFCHKNFYKTCGKIFGLKKLPQHLWQNFQFKKIATKFCINNHLKFSKFSYRLQWFKHYPIVKVLEIDGFGFKKLYYIRRKRVAIVLVANDLISA